MSGFLGLVRLDGAPLEKKFLENFHRASEQDQPSPGEDRWVSSTREMALTRLHQGKLNPAPQPVASPDGRLLLFLEGEIFNDDLDLDDQPRAILNAYLKDGPALFNRLNGQFLLGLVEPEDHRLTIVCDRTGSVPLFWTRQGDLLAFSPRIKPLLSLPGFKHHLNPQAVANFISTGCILEGQCLVQGIQLLRQAQVLTVAGNSFKIHPYWEFGYHDQRDLRDPNVLAGELSELVVQAVRRQTRGSLPFAVPLSGGYDSRSILCSMRRLCPSQPIRTVTWGDEDHRPESDVMVAQHLAEHYKTSHSFYRLDAGSLPQYFRDFVLTSEGRMDAAGNYPEGLGMLKRIQKDLGVDLLFRGNEFFGARASVDRYKQALFVGFLPTFRMQPGSFRYLNPPIYRALADLSDTQMQRIMAGYPYDSFIDRKDHLFICERFYAYHNPLTQLKRLVAEERNPLLDNDIIEFVRRLPPHLRVWKNLFTLAVRHLMPDFDTIGITKYISLVDWDKRMATDLNLQNFVRSTLLDQDSGFNQLVNPQQLRLFLQKAFRPYREKKRSLPSLVVRKIRRRFDLYDLPYSEEIFRLMILKIWVEENLNGDFDLRT
jgi:asparagine synthase (glutamine-hydrolysing)